MDTTTLELIDRMDVAGALLREARDAYRAQRENAASTRKQVEHAAKMIDALTLVINDLFL